MSHQNSLTLGQWLMDGEETFRTPEGSHSLRRGIVVTNESQVLSKIEFDILEEVVLGEQGFRQVTHPRPCLVHFEFADPQISDSRMDDLMAVLYCAMTERAVLEGSVADEDIEVSSFGV